LSLISIENDPIPTGRLSSRDKDHSHTHHTNSETLGELGHLTTFTQRVYKDILQKTLTASPNQQSSQLQHRQENIQNNSQSALHINQPLQNACSEGGPTNTHHETAMTHTHPN
jgi:hypothetical protein